jgi:hypothetical protein
MSNPEFILTENIYGTIFFGPSGDPTSSPPTHYVKSLSNGNLELHSDSGNKSEIVQGAYHEIIEGQLPGDDRKEASQETVTRSITAKQGDIAIIAEDGNIKLKAKNIFIETLGEGNDGSFMVKSNEAVTIVAGEQMTLGGAKVCVTATDSINLNSGGIIYLLCKDISKGSPISGLLGSFVPSQLTSLIDAISQSCK